MIIIITIIITIIIIIINILIIIIINREEILSKYENVSQYLYITKFNYNSIINDNNKLIAIKPDNIDITKTYLYLNDFPYNFQSNIKHYVLWKLTTITKNEVNEVANKLVDDLSAHDYCTYINPPGILF